MLKVNWSTTLSKNAYSYSLCVLKQKVHRRLKFGLRRRIWKYRWNNSRKNPWKNSAWRNSWRNSFRNLKKFLGDSLWNLLAKSVEIAKRITEGIPEQISESLRNLIFESLRNFWFYRNLWRNFWENEESLSNFLEKSLWKMLQESL